MDLIKKYWYIWIIVAIGIFLLPLGINCLSTCEAPFSTWCAPSDWTKFWGQYIWGTVSVIMLFVAWRTLMTTKEINRPFISLDFVEKDTGHAYIRCRNLGKTPALNVKIEIAQSFIDKINNEAVKKVLVEINTTAPFILASNEEKVWDVFIIPNDFFRMRDTLYKETNIYNYRGFQFTEYDWKNNENFFKNNLCECYVSYNNEYKNKYNLDYNNILDGITPDKRMTSNSFSIVTVLAQIRDILDKKRIIMTQKINKLELSWIVNEPLIFVKS